MMITQAKNLEEDGIVPSHSGPAADVLSLTAKTQRREEAISVDHLNTIGTPVYAIDVRPVTGMDVAVRISVPGGPFSLPEAHQTAQKISDTGRRVAYVVGPCFRLAIYRNGLLLANAGGAVPMPMARAGLNSKDAKAQRMAVRA